MLCDIYIRGAKPLFSHGLSRPRASGRGGQRDLVHRCGETPGEERSTGTEIELWGSSKEERDV